MLPEELFIKKFLMANLLPQKLLFSSYVQVQSNALGWVVISKVTYTVYLTTYPS